MDINALLNPAGESQLLDDMLDKEICKAVLNSRKDLEGEEMIDSDDDDVFVDPCPTPTPSCSELLQAASVINGYVNTVDSAFACKVETILASFGCQMRSEEAHNMSPTYINDYFTRK